MEARASTSIVGCPLDFSLRRTLYLLGKGSPYNPKNNIAPNFETRKFPPPPLNAKSSFRGGGNIFPPLKINFPPYPLRSDFPSLRSVFPHTGNMLSARAPLHARHTHMFAFCPFVLQGVGCCKCVWAKMTCVELHVGVKPAMKLGSRSKIASLRMYILRDFDMWKKHAVELLRQFCRLMQRFCAADGCPCFDVLAFSSSTSLTSVHRHPKCTRTFSHREFVFCALCPPTIPKDPASAEGASEEKLAICGKYCAKFS